MDEDPQDKLTGILRIGHINVDFDRHQIDGPDGIKTVEPKVMDVFSVLIKSVGEVVPRKDLIDQVWGVGYGGDERLSRAISLLRKALGDKRGRYKFIKTISQRGYQLTAEITVSGGGKTQVVREMRSLPQTKKSVRQRLLSAMLAVIPFVILTWLTLFSFGENGTFQRSNDVPLVIIMDSAHPSRIYDEQVIADGGTNADILSDILADLPIRTQKELISPIWHRYEAIAKFEPDLIVVHYSGFKREDASGDRPQLRLLVEYFQNTDTKFLIYSRATNDWLEGNMGIILEDVYDESPDLKNRVDVFPLLEYGKPEWLDQASAQGIKLKLKEILDLE